MTCALPAIHSCLVEFGCVSHLVELDGVSRNSKILRYFEGDQSWVCKLFSSEDGFFIAFSENSFSLHEYE